MDLPNTSISSVKLDILQSRVNTILSQLQQAGLFRALVIESHGNRVILDTAFGQLTGQAPDNLNRGDEILARLITGKSEPTIKIEQHQPKTLTLNNRVLNALFISESADPVVARVISHGKNHTLLQLADKNVAIPRQNLLQVGETLLLKPSEQVKPSGRQEVELNRIQPQTILKNALSELLPRSLPNRDSAGLPQLQKLTASLLRLNADIPINQPLPSTQPQQIKENSLSPINQSPIKENQPLLKASEQKVAVQKELQQLLTILSRPLVKVDSIKAESVQQLLTILSLVKSPTTQQTSTPFNSLPDQLKVLQQELKQSPEPFRQLIRQLIVANAASSKKLPSDSALLELSNNYRGELLQQVEQSLNHLLIQKTSVRLQLEQNQPIQFNLNIPLQVDNESTALKLKIRQKQRNETTDEQHWEINLSFEFGLLGLISSHILLQDKKLSAHFWAVKTHTKNLIDSQLDHFKTQLKKAGFELGMFDCFIGQPSTGEEHSSPVSENLVDIKV